MVEVVQHEPRHGRGHQVVEAGGTRQVAELGVLGMEGEGDEGYETAGFILRLSECQHVVNSLSSGLQMPIQKGGIGAHPYEVSFLGHLKPPIAVQLFRTKKLPNPIAEHLGTATGQNLNSRLLKGLQNFRDA